MKPEGSKLQRTIGGIANYAELIVLTGLAVVALVSHLLLHLDSPETVLTLNLAILAVVCLSIVHGRHDVNSARQDLRRLLEKSGGNTADDFFASKTDELALLANAVSEVWLIQESGTLITEQRQTQIEDILAKGGRVRMIVVLPTLLMARLLSFRNAALHEGGLKKRFETFTSRLDAIANSATADNTGLEVRYLPYPVSTTAVFVDPEHRDPRRRRAMIRHAGFRVPFERKLDYLIDGATCPRIFDHFFQEARNIYLNATKVLLLMGEPKSGKTTLLTEVAKAKSNDTALYYALAPARLNGNTRIGFSLETSLNPAQRELATKQPGDLGYRVDARALIQLSSELTNAITEGKVIVLDEIGPLQLQDPKFVEVLWKIIQSPRTTLIASIHKDDAGHAELRKIKCNYRTSLLELEDLGRKKVAEILREELDGALRTAHIMPHIVVGD